MKIIGDKVIFSTGKEKSANCGIIGLSPSGEVTGGYDDGFFNPDYQFDPEFDEEEDTLTSEEQIELADHMIQQWTNFRETALNLKWGCEAMAALGKKVNEEIFTALAEDTKKD